MAIHASCFGTENVHSVDFLVGKCIVFSINELIETTWLTFDGFLKLYQESRDDDNDDDENRLLPNVEVDEAVAKKAIKPEQHFTTPPPRFTEASLVKKLEELGIGRPSTYASIIAVLQERKYVKVEKMRFIPEDRGRIVTIFLENFFRKYVEYDFTAQMEEFLDDVSAGSMEWKKLLTGFWNKFYKNIQGKRIPYRP